MGSADPGADIKKGTLAHLTGLSRPMALVFTYRTGPPAVAGNQAHASASPQTSPTASAMAGFLGDGDASADRFVAEAGVPSADLWASEAWAMADQGIASGESQGGMQHPMPFSCLDLLTAFQGEL